MSIHLFRIGIFLLLSLPQLVTAQSGSDCKSDAEKAVSACRARLDGARGSDVSSYGGRSGVTGGTTSQRDALLAVSQRVGEQKQACENTDLQSCVDKCNEALRDANAKQDTARVQAIKGNVHSCNNRINDLMARADASMQDLRTAAATDSQNADRVCEEGKACGTPDPNLQQVVACGTGYFAYQGRCEPYYFYASGKRNPLAPN